MSSSSLAIGPLSSGLICLPKGFSGRAKRRRPAEIVFSSLTRQQCRNKRNAREKMSHCSLTFSRDWWVSVWKSVSHTYKTARSRWWCASMATSRWLRRITGSKKVTVEKRQTQTSYERCVTLQSIVGELQSKPQVLNQVQVVKKQQLAGVLFNWSVPKEQSLVQKAPE